MGVMVCLDFRYRENPEHRVVEVEELPESERGVRGFGSTAA